VLGAGSVYLFTGEKLLLALTFMKARTLELGMEIESKLEGYGSEMGQHH
jgi:hypothetical protein